MEKNDLDKFIERSDAFDTRKLLEGVILQCGGGTTWRKFIEYGKRGHLKDLPEVESDEVWVNEGYRLKPIHAWRKKRHRKKRRRLSLRRQRAGQGQTRLRRRSYAEANRRMGSGAEGGAV